MASRGKMASRSHCAAWGASSLAANSRAVSAKACCSSVSSKSMDPNLLQADGRVDAVRDGAVVEPALGDGLGLRIEQDDLLAVRAQVAELGGARAGEREQRHRHRDRHIDADLADVDVFLE